MAKQTCEGCPLHPGDAGRCLQFVDDKVGWQFWARDITSNQRCHYNHTEGTPGDPYFDRRVVVKEPS